MAEALPKLPVYLLLDTSASMAGEPLEAVKQGMKALLAELRQDTQASRDCAIAMIVFDSIPRQALPLTAVQQVLLPAMRAGGVSHIMAALELLACCLQNDLTEADGRPVVFLFTDGQWLEPSEVIKQTLQKISATFVICAAGARADLAAIKRLEQAYLPLNSLTCGSFVQYCIWQ